MVLEKVLHKHMGNSVKWITVAISGDLFSLFALIPAHYQAVIQFSHLQVKLISFMFYEDSLMRSLEDPSDSSSKQNGSPISKAPKPALLFLYVTGNLPWCSCPITANVEEHNPASKCFFSSHLLQKNLGLLKLLTCDRLW